MRYIIALAIGLLIIGAGCFYVWHTRSSIEAGIRAKMKEMKAQGKLDPSLQNVDFDSVRIWDFDVTVTDSDLMRLQLAKAMSRFWYVLVILVLALCVGGAFLIGRIRGTK